MRKLGFCKHCNQQFESRRTNHVYCQPSCRTKASYKRNNYKYISGHYQKDQDEENTETGLMVPDKMASQLQIVEEKLDALSKALNENNAINTNSVANAALGTAVVDGTVYATKKIFAPNTLPATKGDFEELRSSINDLKFIMKLK